MFGNINSRRDESSRSLGGKDDRFNVKKHNRYYEPTYSISSEDDSDESQKSIKKLKNNKNDKNLKINSRELELLKKENIELKLKNDVLVMINNVSESMLKNNNLLFDFNSRLEKLENESRNKSNNSNNFNNELSNSKKSIDIIKVINKDELDDSKNKPIGDDSSLNISLTENNPSNSKSPINDKSELSTLPKI